VDLYWRVNEVKMLAAHFTAEMLWSVDKLFFPPPPLSEIFPNMNSVGGRSMHKPNAGRQKKIYELTTELRVNFLIYDNCLHMMCFSGRSVAYSIFN
jgi:hypothetical protein